MVARILERILGLLTSDHLRCLFSDICIRQIHPPLLIAVADILLGLLDPQPDDLLDVIRLSLHNLLPPIERDGVIMNAVFLIGVLLTVVIKDA